MRYGYFERAYARDANGRVTDWFDVHTARRFLERFLGLMGIKEMPEGCALWFPRCTGIHMFFMRIPLDVIWIGEGGKVVRVDSGLRPWRVAFGPKGAKGCLEMAAGTFDLRGIEVEFEASTEGIRSNRTQHRDGR